MAARGSPIRRIAGALALILAAGPALAWQAGTEGRLCTLEHAGAEADVRLTYDPLGPLYSITITRVAPWPDAPVFGLRFDGGAANFITTSRHALSDDGTALSVTDTGFGNVLSGLEFNTRALAVTGTEAVAIDLTGAAPEVAAFRACTRAGLS